MEHIEVNPHKPVARILGPDGELVSSWEGQNTVVTDGLELLASIIGSSSSRPSHMAIGDSDSSIAEDQTALQGTEHERVSFDSTDVSGQEVTYVATFGSGLGSDVTVREAGIFNASSGGTMLARFLTQAFTLPSTQTVEFTWSIRIGE